MSSLFSVMVQWKYVDCFRSSIQKMCERLLLMDILYFLP
jgi:hypothetical protein